MSNETNNLEQALADIITKAIEGIDTATGFLIEQAPDVVQQALTWYMVSSLLESILGIFLLVITVAILASPFKLKPLKKWGEAIGNIECDPLLTYLLIGFPISIGGIILAFNYINLTWLKIWIAPKLWLIEYAGSLVK